MREQGNCPCCVGRTSEVESGYSSSPQERSQTHMTSCRTRSDSECDETNGPERADYGRMHAGRTGWQWGAKPCVKQDRGILAPVRMKLRFPPRSTTASSSFRRRQQVGARLISEGTARYAGSGLHPRSALLCRSICDQYSDDVCKNAEVPFGMKARASGSASGGGAGQEARTRPSPGAPSCSKHS